ncbi:5365_t:CDS:2, partial [Acaulospora colombiana]
MKRKDTTFDDGVPERTKRRRSIRDSLRVKRESFSFLKNKPPAPDTFAFGASPSLYETPEKSRPPATTPDERLEVSVDAPPEGDSALVSSPLGETNSEGLNAAAGGSRQSLSSSKRPTIKHTNSAPSRSNASSIRSESGSVNPSQESSSQRKSMTGLRESVDGHRRHDQGSPSKHRHEHKHHHHSLISKLIPGHGGDKAMDKLEKLTLLEDIAVPQEWLTGVVMIKISDRGEKRRGFRIDPDQGLILWDSKSANIIMIENIKELRKGE